MKKIITIMLLAVALTGAGAGIRAQSLSRIIARTGLTPDDFAMMNAVARGLYDTSAPRPGKTVTWSNADSGSHGTVKLAAMRKNCAYLQHFVYAKAVRSPREIRIHLCRQANGKWLMYP